MSGFILTSYKGAISDYEDKGITGAAKFLSSMDVRRKRDSLKAQQGLTNDLATGGVINARVRFTIPSKDGNTYFGLENGRIIKRTSGGTYSLVYTDADSIITGMAESYDDNGNTFINWTTLTRLHRKQLLDSSGAAVNTNWSDVDATVDGQTYPKTNLTSSSWHTMKWINGSLIGVNKDKLFLVGYDGSYTNDALQVYPGTTGKTLLDGGDIVIVCANRVDNTEESWFFTWDTNALDYNTKRPLSFANINAIIKSEIIMIQYGSDGQIHFLSDEGDLPVIAFPGGGQVYPDGVEVDRGIALFGVYGNGTGKTGIYSYGRRAKNADFVLNLEYQFDCDEINSVKKIGTTLTFSYKIGSSYGVKKVDLSNKATRAIYQSLDLKVPANMVDAPLHGTATMFMAPLPGGCSVELWRRLDKIETGGEDYLGNSTGLNDGWYQCSTPNGGGVYEDDDGIEAVFNLGDTARYLELMVVLNCYGNSSPEIFTIRTEFENE